ncbi:MAG: hypothetical protein QOG45_1013, partial [Chloroflexota bacterium]|nr:hypothetical protein [Chloroflexota bacterium]
MSRRTDGGVETEGFAKLGPVPAQA